MQSCSTLCACSHHRVGAIFSGLSVVPILHALPILCVWPHGVLSLELLASKIDHEAAGKLVGAAGYMLSIWVTPCLGMKHMEELEALLSMPLAWARASGELQYVLMQGRSALRCCKNWLVILGLALCHSALALWPCTAAVSQHILCHCNKLIWVS